MHHAGTPQRSALRDRALAAASWLTTPLLPADYAGLVAPTWSARGLRARIVARHPHTSDAATIVLRPGPGWPGHRAGQHVALGVEVDGVRHVRSFSLTSPPGARRIAVTVKAHPGGLVSEHLVRRAHVGDIVHLGAPDGDFVLPAASLEPALFVTAGSGITPVIAMLRDAPERLRDAVVVHCDRDPSDAIFPAELRSLAYRLHERFTARDGRLTPETLATLVPDWAVRETWACGPAGLLDALTAAYAAADAEHRLHVERFHASLAAAPDGAAGGTITFGRSGRSIDVDATTPLLVAGERAGLALRSGCRMGTCRTCAGTLRSGRVRDLLTGEVHGTPGDMIRMCVSGAAGPAVLDL